VTRGGPIVLPAAEGDLVFVTALMGFSAADLGDRIEVDPEQADRWIAAGLAEAVPVVPPP
jgi:hypothetical protein